MTNANSVKMLSLNFNRDYMKVELSGNRTLLVPLDKFPAIKNLTAKQRENYHIAGGISLDFEGDDEVYHLSELIGINFF